MLRQRASDEVINAGDALCSGEGSVIGRAIPAAAAAIQAEINLYVTTLRTYQQSSRVPIMFTNA